MVKLIDTQAQMRRGTGYWDTGRKIRKGDATRFAEYARKMSEGGYRGGYVSTEHRAEWAELAKVANDDRLRDRTRHARPRAGRRAAGAPHGCCPGGRSCPSGTARRPNRAPYRAHRCRPRPHRDRTGHRRILRGLTKPAPARYPSGPGRKLAPAGGRGPRPPRGSQGPSLIATLVDVAELSRPSGIVARGHAPGPCQVAGAPYCLKAYTNRTIGTMSDNLMRDLIRAGKRAESWTAERDRLIVEARNAGETWPDIAAASGLSRMGVIRIYKVKTANTSD